MKKSELLKILEMSSQDFNYLIDNGVPSIDDNYQEFDLEKAWWNKREETENAWKVSIEEIKKRNYNLEIKNTHKEADTLAKPEVILEKFIATEKKITSIQEEIVKVLTEALQ